MYPLITIKPLNVLNFLTSTTDFKFNNNFNIVNHLNLFSENNFWKIPHHYYINLVNRFTF